MRRFLLSLARLFSNGEFFTIGFVTGFIVGASGGFVLAMYIFQYAFPRFF